MVASFTSLCYYLFCERECSNENMTLGVPVILRNEDDDATHYYVRLAWSWFA